MAGGTAEHTIADDGSYNAPLVLAFPYKRTVGPVLSRFLTSLRDGVVEGTRGTDGRIFVPPAEFDPVTGAPCTEWVAVADTGTVVTWAWQPDVAHGSVLDHPFAWALVRLDGADVPMLHAVDAGLPDRISTGSRVVIRWAAERVGSITDIACFDLEPS
jgi:hypothetical protein